MKFSGKMSLMIILKVRTNQNSTLSLKNTFGKNKEVGGQIDLPVVLGLK